MLAHRLSVVLWPIAAAATSAGLFVPVCLVTSFSYKNIFLMHHMKAHRTPNCSPPTPPPKKQAAHFTQSREKKLPKTHLSWLEINVCLMRGCLKEGKQVFKLCKHWLLQSCHPHTYCLHLYLLSTEAVYMIVWPLKSHFIFHPDTFFSINSQRSLFYTFFCEFVPVTLAVAPNFPNPL